MTQKPSSKSIPQWLPTFLCLTSVWLIPLIVAMLLATANSLKLTYNAYSWFRIVFALGLFGFGLFTTIITFQRAMGQWKEPWAIDGRVLSLVAFWALFPPMWFFTEYYCVDRNCVEIPPETTKIAFLERTKHYAGLAANIWAAFGALLAFVISQAMKPNQRNTR